MFCNLTCKQFSITSSKVQAVGEAVPLKIPCSIQTLLVLLSPQVDSLSMTLLTGLDAN